MSSSSSTYSAWPQSWAATSPVYRAPRSVFPAGITHGTLLQFVTGVLLVGIAEMGADPVNHTKFGIKIAVAAVILLLAWPRRKDVSIAANTYHAIGVLALLNVAVSVFVK